MPKIIYLDYAGTTPIDPRVKRIILKHLERTYGNASSIHSVGLEAKKVIRDAREIIAKILNCRPEELIITGSGTESDNLAIWGAAQEYKKQGNHILTTKIEHPAVIQICRYLEKSGFKVSYLDVGRNGIISPELIKKAIRPETVLVSVMYANNEIGTIQPIKQIAKIIREYRYRNSKNLPVFHTDACQTAGALNINVQELGVDLLTINGSKIYGPQSTGILFVRRGVKLTPQIVGGLQERGLRAGTENPALIAGLAEALKNANATKTKESARLIKLRDYAISEILSKIPDSQLNGDTKLRLPNNINISFANIDGEMLMLALDRKGICVSTGSACSSSSTEPSHVIQAIGLPDKFAKGNLRITLGRETTKEDINYLLKILPPAVKKMRK